MKALAIVILLAVTSVASAQDYSLFTAPLPARAVTTPTAAPASTSYGVNASGEQITGRWTEVGGRWAKVGPSGEVLAYENPPGLNVQPSVQSAPVQYASYTPTYSPPIQAALVSYQPAPAYMPSYQPSYAPAQYTSAPVCYGGNCASGNCGASYASPFSFGGSVCGPGGCSSCANGRCR